MSKTREFVLSSRSTREEIIRVLEHLATDAEHEAAQNAYRHLCGGSFTPQNGSTEERRAFYYEGQRKILRRLLWALNGTAEEEGCEGAVGIG